MAEPVVQLFVNPRPKPAGRERIEALRRAFERRGATVIVTESAAGRLAIDPRADHVCSAGGDGTLRHVVDAVRRSGRAISVSAFPAGTVNLVATERGYPRSPDAFVTRVLGESHARSHFIARVGETPMLACASVGPDSAIVAALSPMLKRWIGRAAYVVAFLRLLPRWPRVALSVRIGGEVVVCEAIYVAKGRYFAGRWSFAPQASVLEPELHVVTLSRASRWRFCRFAFRMLRGGSVDTLAGVRCFRCTELTITGSVAAPVQTDGDIIDRLPVTIEVEAEAIAFR